MGLAYAEDAPNLWGLGLLILALLLVVPWTIQAWRWRIVLDDEGMVVEPGFGRTRRVSWDQVRGVRVERPSAVELRDADDIRLDGASGPPVRNSQVRELADVIGEVRPGS